MEPLKISEFQEEVRRLEEVLKNDPHVPTATIIASHDVRRVRLARQRCEKMLELFGSASPGPRQWKGLDKPNEQTRQEPKTKRLQRPKISIVENRMLPGKIRIVPAPEPYDPTKPGFVWTRPRKLQPPTETVEEEARLLEEILITKEPETIHSAVHSDLRDEQSPCQGNPLTITTAVTSKVACLPSWVRHDDAPLLMDYPDKFEDKPGDLFKRPRKRPPQTLEQLLATLTPLDQVRSQPFLPHQKRRRFKAYDQELRLYQTGNGRGEIVGAAIIKNEDAGTLQWVAKCFKQENSNACSKIRCFMSDKDLNERNAFIKSNNLPCRHIMAHRAFVNKPIFDHNLCANKWSKKYEVQLSSTKKIDVTSELHETSSLGSTIISKIPVRSIKTVSQRRKALSERANDLIEIGSLSTGETYKKKEELLDKLIEGWRQGRIGKIVFKDEFEPRCSRQKLDETEKERQEKQLTLQEIVMPSPVRVKGRPTGINKTTTGFFPRKKK
ncbi:hypothetical protein KQX54_010714 [Cotesia glomerata]|uniref:ZSWIM1/3 RNaseH-like domain-containing protein n=1 Tax=Cotesia glomerata TaxID=32391 RepID=A0AAV7IY46_COTGL|nr:hypothetical protein KQX54_010714 [Cotesia glomerata]